MQTFLPTLLVLSLCLLRAAPAQAADPVFEDSLLTIPNVDFGSMAWGDYDDDGRLDLILAGFTASGIVCEVWRNTGNGFTNIQAGFPGVFFSSVQWCDVDNDNKLDVLLSGSSFEGASVAQVWRNTGSGFELLGILTNTFNQLEAEAIGRIDSGDFNNDGLNDVVMGGNFIEFPFFDIWRNDTNGFTVVDTGFPQLSSSSVAAADPNKDGWLDVLASGLASESSEERTGGLWINTTNGFDRASLVLPGVWDPILAWGDFNNDGWPDFLFAGSDDEFPTITPMMDLWLNTTNGFQKATFPFPITGISAGEAAWGDIDNDGLSDLAIAGLTQPGGEYVQTAQVWINAGNQFNTVWSETLETERPALALGDYDNDGRLDFAHSGFMVPGDLPKAVLLRNITVLSNTPPAAPSGSQVTIVGEFARLSWDAASDAETPAEALTYNVRVGTIPGGVDVISPMSAASGHRKLPRAGNASSRLFTYLKIQPGVTYHWSVQAIDGGLAGGPFSSEHVFPQSSTPPRVTGIFLLENNQVRLTFTGSPGLSYQIEATAGLTAPGGSSNAWVTLGAGVSIGAGDYEFVDENVERADQKFYRIVGP